MDSLGRKCVLFVDDEEGLRQLAQWDLTGQSFDLKLAADGDEALKLLESQRVDVVISDITMPKLSGLGLLREIRQKHPSIEVIIVTGFGTVEMAVAAMKDGAFDFLLKPYDREILESTVEAALLHSGRHSREFGN